MGKLNKYILLIGCYVGCFMTLDTIAATYDCRLVNPSCEEHGYTDKKSSCPGGYIACPFNTAVAVCDREADSDDYVFTEAFSPEDSSGWTDVLDSYSYKFNNKFIVGKSNPAVRCGEGFSDFGYGAGFLAAHTHNPVNTTMTGLSVVKQNRDGATGHTADVWTGFTTVASGSLGTTKSVVSFGETFTGGIVYPVPVNKIAGMFSYSDPITSYDGNTSDKIPSSKPSCSNLGYSDSKSHCPGSYVKCPYAEPLEDYVMCDMQAKAGEIKFSLQTKDHDGWLLCDGRSFSVLGTDYANSELSKILDMLPDYRGVFISVDEYRRGLVNEDNVPYHSHDIIAASMSQRSSHSSQNYCKSGCKGSWSAAVGTYSAPVEQTTILNTYQQTTLNGNETAPEHYVANVFVYSGKIGLNK